MLNETQTLQKVYDTCETPCQASKILPKELFSYKTETIPEKAGQHCNADVMEESGQKILIMRENLTSFTDAIFIKNQTKPVIREAIIILASRLKIGNKLVVRVDGQSSLASLRTDTILKDLNICLEVGRPKNANKNAVADKAIRELREQIIKLSPHGGPISSSTLARAISFLNSIIRAPGRSSQELWLSRDSSSGANIQISDDQLSLDQLHRRQASHSSSAAYSSRH